MEKKYEFITGDSVQVGHRRLFRIRALRDFGGIRRGDIGGYIECEANLDHSGEAWVADVAQVYGPHGCVRDNGRASGESWILGRVDGDAQICDLVVIGEGAHVGGRTILCGDEIVTGDDRQPPGARSVNRRERPCLRM
ncbi:MAG: hypothetical protein WBE37_25370 [Bryobacteraceae bacterium]